MTIVSTAKFQEATEVSDAVGDISADLNVAEDAIEDGNWVEALATLREQRDNLDSVIEFVEAQIPAATEEET
jgi:hypothetical protein